MLLTYWMTLCTRERVIGYAIVFAIMLVLFLINLKTTKTWLWRLLLGISIGGALLTILTMIFLPSGMFGKQIVAEFIALDIFSIFLFSCVNRILNSKWG